MQTCFGVVKKWSASLPPPRPTAALFHSAKGGRADADEPAVYSDWAGVNLLSDAMGAIRFCIQTLEAITAHSREETLTNLMPRYAWSPFPS